MDIMYIHTQTLIHTLSQKGCGSNLSAVKVSSSDRELELEMKKVQRSEEERNGDTVVRNRDSSKNEPATAVWNGDTAGGDSSSSHTGTERGRGTDLHLMTF